MDEKSCLLELEIRDERFLLSEKYVSWLEARVIQCSLSLETSTLAGSVYCYSPRTGSRDRITRQGDGLWERLTRLMGPRQPGKWRRYPDRIEALERVGRLSMRRRFIIARHHHSLVIRKVIYIATRRNSQWDNKSRPVAEARSSGIRRSTTVLIPSRR